MVEIWVPGDPVPPEIEGFSFVDWITESVAITSYARACDKDILGIEGIDGVVSIGKLSPDAEKIGVDVVQFDGIQDATDDISDDDISACVDAIREMSEKGKTLVHCAAGVSRSPGLVALTLCVDRGWDWGEAEAYVRERRGVTDIHPLTQTRLKAWLEKRRSLSSTG
jgi:predicted protein tyrosine phosphatase